jgi:hypothetical protein
MSAKLSHRRAVLAIGRRGPRQGEDKREMVLSFDFPRTFALRISYAINPLGRLRAWCALVATFANRDGGTPCVPIDTHESQKGVPRVCSNRLKSPLIRAA